MKIVKRSLGFVFKCAQHRDQGLVDEKKKRHIQKERGIKGSWSADPGKTKNS